MFALVARFDCLNEAAAEQFDVLTAEAVSTITAKEPGTLVYATHCVDGEPLARVFYEVYRDHAAFQAHETADHVRHFHATKAPLLANTRVEFLTPGPTKPASPV